MLIVSKSRSSANLWINSHSFLHYILFYFYKQVLLSTYCVLSTGLYILHIVNNWGMGLDFSGSQSNLQNRSRMHIPQDF